MDDAFEKLKKEGKTDVDSLIKWMVDSKVIEDVKAVEDQARTLLSDAADKQSVELVKFKETIAKLAEEQKKKVEDLHKILTEEAPKRLQGAFEAGVSAFKDAISKK